MRKYALLALCLCGSLLLISSCGGSVGRLQPQPLTITSAVLPLANLKEAYGGSAGFSVTAAGGVPPYSWTWKAADGSTLPPGLKLFSNPDSTGTISGIPTNTGPYVVIVTVTDSASRARQKSNTYIITVSTSADVVWPTAAVASVQFPTKMTVMKPKNCKQKWRVPDIVGSICQLD